MSAGVFNMQNVCTITLGVVSLPLLSNKGNEIHGQQTQAYKATPP
jgi:hypothetical protein